MAVATVGGIISLQSTSELFSRYRDINYCYQDSKCAEISNKFKEISMYGESKTPSKNLRQWTELGELITGLLSSKADYYREILGDLGLGNKKIIPTFLDYITVESNCPVVLPNIKTYRGKGRKPLFLSKNKDTWILTQVVGIEEFTEDELKHLDLLTHYEHAKELFSYYNKLRRDNKVSDLRCVNYGYASHERGTVIFWFAFKYER